MLKAYLACVFLAVVVWISFGLGYKNGQQAMWDAVQPTIEENNKAMRNASILIRQQRDLLSKR